VSVELVLTVLADDRPGVVEGVAAAVAAHGGSWRESRLAVLGGRFAGIVAVTVPDGAVDALQRDLAALPGMAVGVVPGAVRGGQVRRHRLEVVANDRPGIVAEVARALAGAGVNVDELASTVEPASMSGGMLFRATIDVGLVGAQALADVVAALEGLSDDLMIDVDAEGADPS
jgi:glycine cleavage system regulatory protein